MNFTVGIIGAGEIARKIHIPVLLNIPRVKIAWVADANASRAEAIGSAYGVRHLRAQSGEDLPPCDVVLLAIPIGSRGSYLQFYSKTECAVFCEKPFAETEREHQRLLDMFPPHRLGCAFMRRFYSSSLLMRQFVRDAWLGSLLRICVSEGNRSRGSGVDESFLDDNRANAHAGALADLGSHSIDLALYLSGAQKFEVKAVEMVVDGQVDRKISAKVKLMESPYVPSGGADLDYCVSWLDRQTNTIELQFERASLWAPIAPNGQVFIGNAQRPDSALTLLSPREGASTANQAFYLEWEAFLDGIAARQESSVSALSALRTTRLVENLYEVGRMNRA